MRERESMMGSEDMMWATHLRIEGRMSFLEGCWADFGRPVWSDHASGGRSGSVGPKKMGLAV